MLQSDKIVGGVHVAIALQNITCSQPKALALARLGNNPQPQRLPSTTHTVAVGTTTAQVVRRVQLTAHLKHIAC